MPFLVLNMDATPNMFACLDAVVSHILVWRVPRSTLVLPLRYRLLPARWLVLAGSAVNAVLPPPVRGSSGSSACNALVLPAFDGC